MRQIEMNVSLRFAKFWYWLQAAELGRKLQKYRKKNSHSLVVLMKLIFAHRGVCFQCSHCLLSKRIQTFSLSKIRQWGKSLGHLKGRTISPIIVWQYEKDTTDSQSRLGKMLKQTQRTQLLEQLEKCRIWTENSILEKKCNGHFRTEKNDLWY